MILVSLDFAVLKEIISSTDNPQIHFRQTWYNPILKFYEEIEINAKYWSDNLLIKEIIDYFLNWYFVRDNGIGIDFKDEEQVFKAFKRVAGEDYSGSGIGLAVVKRIIEKQLFTI